MNSSWPTGIAVDHNPVTPIQGYWSVQAVPLGKGNPSTHFSTLSTSATFVVCVCVCMGGGGGLDRISTGFCFLTVCHIWLKICDWCIKSHNRPTHPWIGMWSSVISGEGIIDQNDSWRSHLYLFHTLENLVYRDFLNTLIGSFTPR